MAELGSLHLALFVAAAVVAVTLAEPEGLPSEVKGLKIKSTLSSFTPLFSPGFTVECEVTGSELDEGARLVSVVISRWSEKDNKFGELAEIDALGSQGVTIFEQLKDAQYTGDIQADSGHANLKVTFENPESEASGTYGCTANLLLKNGRTNTLEVSTTISTAELSLQEVAAYMLEGLKEVKGLKETVDKQQSTIDGIAEIIDALEVDIDSLKEFASNSSCDCGVDGSIGAVDQRLSDLKTELDGVRQVVGPLTSSVSAVQTEMSEFNSSITDLETTVQAVQATTESIKTAVQATTSRLHVTERAVRASEVNYNLLKRAVTLDVYNVTDGDFYLFTTKQKYDNVDDAQEACEFVNGKLWEATAERMTDLERDMRAASFIDSGYWIGWTATKSGSWEFLVSGEPVGPLPWSDSASHGCARFYPYDEGQESFVNAACSGGRAFRALCAV